MWHGAPRRDSRGMWHGAPRRHCRGIRGCSMRLPHLCLAVLISLPANALDTPKSLDPRLTVELVAQEPEIVTPTGIAVDSKGRIFVIENNTHQVNKNYKGYP